MRSVRYFPILVICLFFGICEAPRAEVAAQTPPCLGSGLSAKGDDVARQLSRLVETSSMEEGEHLVIELASCFDAQPRVLIAEAFAVGLTEEQIAEILSALPVDYVDRPCARRKRLNSRIELLGTIGLSAQHAGQISKFLRRSLELEAKACEMKSD